MKQDKQEIDYVAELKRLRGEREKQIADEKKNKQAALAPVLKVLDTLREAGQITSTEIIGGGPDELQVKISVLCNPGDAWSDPEVVVSCIEAEPYADLRDPIDWVIRLESISEKSETFGRKVTYEPVIASLLRRIAAVQARGLK